MDKYRVIAESLSHKGELLEFAKQIIATYDGYNRSYIKDALWKAFANDNIDNSLILQGLAQLEALITAETDPWIRAMCVSAKAALQPKLDIRSAIDTLLPTFDSFHQYLVYDEITRMFIIADRQAELVPLIDSFDFSAIIPRQTAYGRLFWALINNEQEELFLQLGVHSTGLLHAGKNTDLLKSKIAQAPKFSKRYLILETIRYCSAVGKNLEFAPYQIYKAAELVETILSIEPAWRTEEHLTACVETIAHVSHAGNLYQHLNSTDTNPDKILATWLEIKEYLNSKSIPPSAWHIGLILTCMAANQTLQEHEAETNHLLQNIAGTNSNATYTAVSQIKSIKRTSQFTRIASDGPMQIISYFIDVSTFPMYAQRKVEETKIYYPENQSIADRNLDLLKKCEQYNSDLSAKLARNIFLLEYPEVASYLEFKYANIAELVHTLNTCIDQLGLRYMQQPLLDTKMSEAEYLRVLRFLKDDQRIISSYKSLQYLGKSGLDNLIQIACDDQGKAQLSNNLTATLRIIANNSPKALPGIVSVLRANGGEDPIKYRLNNEKTDIYRHVISEMDITDEILYQIWRDFWVHPAPNKSYMFTADLDSTNDQQIKLSVDQARLMNQLRLEIVHALRISIAQLLLAGEESTALKKILVRAYQLRRAIIADQATDPEEFATKLMQKTEKIVNQLEISIISGQLGVPFNSHVLDIYERIREEDNAPERAKAFFPNRINPRFQIKVPQVNHFISLEENIAPLNLELSKILAMESAASNDKEAKAFKLVLIALKKLTGDKVEHNNRYWYNLLNTFPYFDEQGEIGIETYHILEGAKLLDVDMSAMANMFVNWRKRVMELFTHHYTGEETLDLYLSLNSSPISFLSRSAVGICTYSDYYSYLISAHADVFSVQDSGSILLVEALFANNHIYALSVADEHQNSRKIMFWRAANVFHAFKQDEVYAPFVAAFAQKLKEYAMANGFDGLVLCGHNNWHPDSNSPAMIDVFNRLLRRAENKVSFTTPVSIASGSTIDYGHILWEQEHGYIPRKVFSYENLMETYATSRLGTGTVGVSAV